MQIGSRKCFKYSGGDQFLVSIQDNGLRARLEELQWPCLRECFIDIVSWSKFSTTTNRTVWVEVYGVPIHMCHYKRIAETWGSLVSLGSNKRMMEDYKEGDESPVSGRKIKEEDFENGMMMMPFNEMSWEIEHGSEGMLGISANRVALGIDEMIKNISCDGNSEVLEKRAKWDTNGIVNIVDDNVTKAIVI
ncbi:hypothetical protein PVK06_041720 [Gossypium arboreum]|uniref:DUF4283 domain-containing protein n=1 Tax=Gossypium arboreum TaxID=29729 RepID=A0ABR0N942_GOSAR|nr:hypothetical protein PVK06_041720 [Gossypium arboreum]